MPDASTPPIGEVPPELVSKLDALARQIDSHVGSAGTGIIYFETFEDGERRPCTRSEHYQCALDAAFRGAIQMVAEYPQLPDCPTTAAEPIAGLHGIRQWCERCKRVAGSTDLPTASERSMTEHDTITARELPTLVEPAIQILAYVGDQKGRLIPSTELNRRLQISPGSITKHKTHLIEIGLLHTPDGIRSGVALTPAGSEYLNSTLPTK